MKRVAFILVVCSAVSILGITNVSLGAIIGGFSNNKNYVMPQSDLQLEPTSDEVYGLLSGAIDFDNTEFPPIEVLKNKLAKLINVDPEDIQIESIQKVEWPDSALGYEEPGKVYLQVIMPGYKIVVKAGNKQYEIHTAGDVAKVKIDGKVHTFLLKKVSEEKNNNVEKKSDTIKEVAKKLKDVKNKIKQFYNVDDLAELGEYGEKLKELLNQKIPENAENIKIVENFGKDGKYNLEITYEVQESDDFRSKNVIALEGEWKGQEGNLPVVTLTPEKLSFKKFPLEGGMIGGGVIEEFIFNSEGIEYNLIW